MIRGDKMNISAIKLNNEVTPQGFSIAPFAINPRLQVIKLSSETVKGFIEQVLPLGVQALSTSLFYVFMLLIFLINLPMIR